MTVSSPASAPPAPRLKLPLAPVRATYVLMALNALIFVVTWRGEHWLYFGAVQPVLLLGRGEWWRLLTSGFLHWDLLHIALNLYALYGLGPLLERFLGLPRFLGVYFVSMVGSSILMAVLTPPNTWGVGASGAIMGVLGSLLVYYWQYRDKLVGGRNYANELLKMAGINLAIGLFTRVSLWGHLGGFLAGMMLGYAVLPYYRYAAWPEPRLQKLALTARQRWMVLGTAFAWALVLGLGIWLRGARYG